jgi:hypothetical protein
MEQRQLPHGCVDISHKRTRQISHEEVKSNFLSTEVLGECKIRLRNYHLEKTVRRDV